MAILNSTDNSVVKDYSTDELIQKAKEMRSYSMISIHAAGSGHPGGTLSIMDIAAALYLKVACHDPKNPDWEGRDRIFWSAGHKAPAIYAALAASGYFPFEETVKLRKLGSGFEGHPNRLRLQGIELSSGSLGQGLGVAVGSALDAKLEKRKNRVYCILGDGEHNEGSVWESIMSAANYNLNNLIAIVDLNGLQIDGPTDDVMCLGSLKEKYESFGWEVLEIDGHDMEAIVEAFSKASEIKDKPTAIIAHTVKGKGVSYAENVVGYHGAPPKDGRSGEESLDKALDDIGDPQFTKEKVDSLLKIASDYQKIVDKKMVEKLPKFSKSYWWNDSEDMKVDMVPTRNGFGDALAEIGSDKNIVAHGADITSSIRMNKFYADFPERKNRFFSIGIAEANMTLIASGFAREGKSAFVGSYGVFATGRAWDQLRTTACYNKFNINIADAHGGISVGPDGATHQALEEIAVINYLPNIVLTVPCDSNETYKSTKAITYEEGPSVVRYARTATPIVTDKETPYEFGITNIIRFRGRKAKFPDAFEWKLGTEYESEGEAVSLIACGPMLPEAMRAAWILKEEYGIESRILDVHTVKPLDMETINKAAADTNAVITCEEHQVGGFGNIVAGAINTSKNITSPLVMDMVGVQDIFGESGAPWELMIDFKLVAENIVEKAKKLFDKKSQML